MNCEIFQPFFKTLAGMFTVRGYQLYLVGGCVRDKLMGKEPKDYDMTCNCLPEKTQEILSTNGYNPVPIGQKFGTIGALIDGQKIEITTHRKDLTKGRKPEVAFTEDLTTDLERRDFTMNSIAINKDGNLIDPFNGQKDIKNKIIRATGNPYERFAEDPLRMFRAIRFISQLNVEINYKDYFIIENNTYNAICNYAPSILTISHERWLEEMNKLLVGCAPHLALDYLKNSRLLYYMVPEIMPLALDIKGSLPSKNIWLHTLEVIKKSKNDIDVRWASFLHDIAKPQTYMERDGEVHFFQHEILGADMAENICRRFKMSNEQRKSIKGLVALHQRVGDVVSRKNNPPVSISALRRVIRECEVYGCSIENLVSLFEADCSSRKPSVIERQIAHTELLRKALTEIKEEDLRPRLPSGIGTIIMEKLNLQPGPEVKKVKDILYNMLLDGDVTPNMSSEEIVEEYLEDLKMDVYV